MVECFLGLLGYFLDATCIRISRTETSSQMPSLHHKHVTSSLHILSTQYSVVLLIIQHYIAKSSETSLDYFYRCTVYFEDTRWLSILVYRPVNKISNTLSYQLPSSSTYGISTEYSWQPGSNKLNLLQTQMRQGNSFGITTCKNFVSAWGLSFSQQTATKLQSWGMWRRVSYVLQSLAFSIFWEKCCGYDV